MRIAWLMPALLVVSVLVFYITHRSDAIEAADDFITTGMLHLRFTDEFNQIPLFYFTIRSLNEPDSTWKMKPGEQEKFNSDFSWKNLIPVIEFHSDNHYHRWLWGDKTTGTRGIIRGDFGNSIQTGMPVGRQLVPALIRSFIIVFVSLALSFLISLFVAVYQVTHAGNLLSKMLRVLFFILYVTPSFWLAVILLMLFANPAVLAVFPVTGWPTHGVSFAEYCHHLALPVACYALGAVAYFSRITEAGLMEVMQNDFLTSARARGISEMKLIVKHALPHAIMPSITALGYLFPLAVSGSVIIETVYSIPGMSQMLYQAALTRDVTVLAAICSISCLITMSGFLITEITQSLIDPRLRKKKVVL